MKLHVKTIIMLSLLCGCNATIIYGQYQKAVTKIVSIKPEVINSINYNTYPYPYNSSKLEYYMWGTEDQRVFGKYKKRYSYTIKEPLQDIIYYRDKRTNQSFVFPVAKKRATEDTLQMVYKFFHLDDNRDSLMRHISRLDSVLKKYKRWDNPIVEYYKRIGLSNITFVMLSFDKKKYVKVEDIEDAANVANDIYPEGWFIKYPAWADSFIFNYKTEKWEYVESVYVENDHDQELYVYGKYAPWYFEEYKNRVKKK